MIRHSDCRVPPKTYDHLTAYLQVIYTIHEIIQTTPDTAKPCQERRENNHIDDNTFTQ